MNNGILFSTSSELIRLPAEAIVYITADGNYSVVTMADGSEYVLTMQLGQIERYIVEITPGDDNRFIRVGRSLIINRDFITLINPSRQKLTLSDCRNFRHDVSAPSEALKVLKGFIERRNRNEQSTV